MKYNFDLNRIKEHKMLLDRRYGVPRGKEPKDLWKNTISLTPNSGVRSAIFKNKEIVNLLGTVEAAYRSLMKFANENQDLAVRDRFLNEDEILDWAKWMKEEFETYANVDYDIMCYYDFIIAYYVVTPFYGFGAEYQLSNYLNRKFKENNLDKRCYTEDEMSRDICKRFGCRDGEDMDKKWLIDILVDDNIAIQVKSKTFLLGGGYRSFEDDYNSLKIAAQTLKDKYGIKKYYFAFYGENGTWLQNNNNKFLFDSNYVFKLFDENTPQRRKEIVRKLKSKKL
jgi:hypothetical protein